MGENTTEDQFDATDQGRAINSFLQYSLSLTMAWTGAEIGGAVTGVLGEIGKALVNSSEFAAQMSAASPEELASLRGTQKFVELFDAGHQEAVRSSILVIGACSAIEACIEDLAKGVIRSRPATLDGTAFSSNAISQAYSLTNPEEIVDKQWRRIDDKTDRQLPFCDRFEAKLKVINCDGYVPGLVKHVFDTAYAIRNVWAHNAGYADAGFIAKAPHLNYQLGELVHLKLEDKAAGRYLSAVMTYGMIVANRERARLGLGPIPMAGKPGETDYGQAYNAMYL